MAVSCVCLPTLYLLFMTELLQPQGTHMLWETRKESCERIIPFVLNLYTKSVCHELGLKNMG